MNILYFAKDAPQVNSGYGKCCREICTRLQRAGFNITITATVGNKASPIYKYEGIEVLPGAEDAFAEDIMLNHYLYANADLLITQFDIWPLSQIYRFAKEGKINWLPYVPIDFYPIPQKVHHKLRHGLQILTMCDWANQELTKLNFECTTIHHGINKEIHKHLPGQKAQLKEKLGVEPDCFLIGIVQANQLYRKAWEEQLQGIALFIQQHPEIKTRIYLHTLPHTEQGYDLPLLLKDYGLENITLIADPYKWIMGIQEEQMAEIYNSFDMLLSATAGEGFGLPVIEAQACGCPVIATDVMSFPELIKYGSLVPIDRWFRSPNSIMKAVPSIQGIAEALFNVHQTKWDPIEIQNTAHYLWDWDEVIIPKWIMALENLQEKIDISCTRPPRPSKELLRKSRKEFTL